MAAPPDTLRSCAVIVSHQLSSGSSLVLSARPPGAPADALVLVVGGGRGCVLRVDGLLGGMWLPLRGRLQLGGSGAEGVLLPGEVRITEAETGGGVGRGNALWIALLGTRLAWRKALEGSTQMPLPEPLLLPTWHAADRTLRRRTIALVRAAAHGAAEPALHAVIESLFDLQEAHTAAIERCPGRTYAQRRQVFVRLQRVRNYLAANCHLDVDNDRLARMASYSPWHFIRAFRAAYEQTPHAFLVDQRLQRARRLLRSSALAVAEIALASGFENRCAFSRLFRQRFGVTAGALRRQAQAPVSRNSWREAHVR
jgi:AraC family transcriptional regulator